MYSGEGQTLQKHGKVELDESLILPATLCVILVKLSSSLVNADSFPVPQERKCRGYPLCTKVRSLFPWFPTKEELKSNEFMSYFLIVQ